MTDHVLDETTLEVVKVGRRWAVLHRPSGCHVMVWRRNPHADRSMEVVFHSTRRGAQLAMDESVAFHRVTRATRPWDCTRDQDPGCGCDACDSERGEKLSR